MSKRGKLFLIPSAIAPATGLNFLNKQIEEAIRTTSYYLVENVREARRFISSLQLGINISELNFEQLDKKTRYEQLPRLFEKVAKDQNIGVISDAGCPGVADPGALAVKFAHAQRMKVVPLVGPSSLLLALMGSGMNGQSFSFVGYLPIKPKEAKAEIQKLESNSRRLNQTQLFIETPYRSDKMLQLLLATLQPSTSLCLASNLMGENELLKTKIVAEWKKNIPVLGKQPTVFLFTA